MSRLVSSFVPKQARAIAVAMEADVLATGPAGQTLNDPNLINSARHRFVGSGTGETITLADIAKARYALQKANVPMTNLVGIVCPEVTHTLQTLAGATGLLTPDPKWQNVIKDGISTGMRFAFSLYGFDIYESNHLKQNTASETIATVTSAAGVNNLFFSAAGDVLPFVGAVRQQPKVDSEFNKDLQRDEYVTTCRYDFKLYRPENLVCIVTDVDQVYA